MSHVDPENNTQSAGATSGSNLFENKQIRHNFIKKVYTLLSIQLIISECVVALFMLLPGLKAWANDNPLLYLGSTLVTFIIIIVVSCMKKLRRKHPHNLFILFSFTIAQSLILASVAVAQDTKVVLLAAGLTTVICLGLTIFALQTKYDFTTLNGVMLVILFVLLITFPMGFLFHPSHIGTIMVSGIMAVIMGVFLVIDTQMIMGGTHSVQISPEEYIFAVINLYLDIVNMFLYILWILAQDG